MSEITGKVVQNFSYTAWLFREDGTENLQQLSKATINEDFATRLRKEIHLDQYQNEYMRVSGNWEHDWILEAEILEHHK